MDWESPWHMFVFEHGRALMVYAALHVPIWCMKGGRWSSLWSGDKP